MTDKPEQPAEKSLPINRREFLNLAWLASLGFFTLGTVAATYLFAMPIFEEGEFGGIVDAGAVGELPPPGNPPVNQPKVKLWISNTEEGVVALYKVCTHLGCLYNFNTQQNKFLCPCHGSQFQPDGSYIQGPASRSLDRFVLQIVSPDGEVLAETDPESGAPVPLPADPEARIKVDTAQKILGETHV